MNSFHEATSSARSRQQQADHTRARVLEAAIALIEQKGEAGLRVVEVAEQAGVSVASIYNYFTNRDELVTAARVEQYLASVGADVERIGQVLTQAQDPAEYISLMRDVSREASAADRADRRWRRAEVLGAARRRPELATRIGETQHQINRELTRIARLGQERGLLDPTLDPAALAVFVQAFTFGLVLADVDPGLELDEESWLDVVTRFTASITPPGGGGPGFSVPPPRPSAGR